MVSPGSRTVQLFRLRAKTVPAMQILVESEILCVLVDSLNGPLLVRFVPETVQQTPSIMEEKARDDASAHNGHDTTPGASCLWRLHCVKRPGSLASLRATV
jgi:hypothetical protein